ncbi:phosphomannomutase CpsG [Parashewanella spongiae]|uniref:phosphomannomutase n=1 Tax=Parashewanella spongiae TaxID=342950 RepID=A0A3A6T8L9_9GAMM|nr:phosphomannomutase CpsG [Parashewanella spongiae]MCL1079032.1 phosphomannomutase CpsG [Parashewanella spongiae]RJY10965.1 phosphomannomutase CpsG [Parashewanella spongiae]
MTNLTCFKAYDIRGQLGDELNITIAYRIGRAFAQYLKPSVVALGADIRLSSESLKNALAQGLMDEGVNVIDLGMTGTEEVYFAAQYLDIDGAIEVTASHNPIDYNGMKLVKRGAVPISGDTGLNDIKALAETNNFGDVKNKGSLTKKSILKPYVKHLLSYLKHQEEAVTPLHLVVNAGNGAAGHVIDALEESFIQSNIPIRFTKICHEADGNFPNGIPNPLLVDNRAITTNAVIEHQADLGIAWDGDFDRCFLFDEKGCFIEGYYIVGLLAQASLANNPGSKIIHDPRLTWNTKDLVQASGGITIQSKTGHAFIKERMRKEDAIYGGEMSAHHYFRDFSYCDSGMIPWLLVASLMSATKKSLSQLINHRIELFPASGEINLTIKDAKKAVDSIENHYKESANIIDKTDGISMEFELWRFNLRSSNTEPVVRLNVESRQNVPLMRQKTHELLELLNRFS